MSIIIIVLALIPGFAWLFFYLQEDLHPEPKRLIAKTFIMGMVAAIFALAIEIILNTSFGIISVGQLAFLTLLGLAAIEEFFKFGAAYLSVHKNPAFDEPVDAMIYMVVAALGFATVENLGAIGGGTSSQTAILSNAFTTTSLRFVGATLLHSLTSATLGYYWALGIRQFKAKKYILAGFLLAALLHGMFNYLIISYGSVIYSVMFLVVIGFFVLGGFERLKRKAL